MLNKWTCLPESTLAELESLEQLRLIEAGMTMIAVAIEQAANGIDTAADYSAFVERFRNQIVKKLVKGPAWFLLAR